MLVAHFCCAHASAHDTDQEGAIAVSLTGPSLSTGRRRGLRALTGVLAAVPALLVWAIAAPGLGVELPFTDAQGKEQEINAGAVVMFSIVPALLGWVLLAALERFAPNRALTIWTAVATAVLVVSLLPLVSMSGGAALTLGLIHLVVGGVIIAVLRTTSPRRTAPALTATVS
jgi:hypothetical protein